MLDGFDGLVLVNGLDVHGNDLAGIHIKEILQQLVAQVRSRNIQKADRPEDARYRMCKSSGYIRSQTSKYLKGDWDLTGGFSGGPLVEYISGAGYVAIGIHKDGSTIDGSSYPTSYTGALRITQSLYTLFLSYRG